MFPRPSKGWIWLLLPVSAAAIFVSATLFYYPGSYNPPSGATSPVEQTSLPSYRPGGGIETLVAREGVLIIDNAHSNSYDPEGELSSLISKVTARGYEAEYLLRRDVPWWSFSRTDRHAFFEDQLRRADSLALILPTIAYAPDEVRAVQQFLRKGGRLLLIGDPGRDHDINSIAAKLGFVFQPGYLYNVVEHDLNYRNILIRDFRPDEVTEGLRTIALHTAGSIRSSGAPLAFTDTNTYSSAEGRPQPFSPLAKSLDGSILAISDMTFLMPPQNGTADNSRLISNIADFLTLGDRDFDLEDFPHFFKDDVEILLGHAELFDTRSLLRSILSDAGVDSRFQVVEDLTKDTVFLGLYQDSLAVSQYLDIAGVQVGETLRTPFSPSMAAEGTAVLMLHEGQDRRVLIVMGKSAGALRGLLDRLESGAFRDGMLSDSLGVFRIP